MEYENSIVQSGYVTYIKEIGKLRSISLGLGVKQANGEYKTGFLEIRGSKEILGGLEKGDKVKVKGFVSFNFWTPKDSDKEMQKIVMVVNEVLGWEEKSDQDKKTTSTKTSTKTTSKKQADVKESPKPTPPKEEELPEIDMDEDEIPF